MSIFHDLKNSDISKLSGEHHRFIRQQLSVLLHKVLSVQIPVKEFSFTVAHSNYGLEYEYPYGYVMVLFYENFITVSFSINNENLFKGIKSFFYNIDVRVDDDFNYLSATIKNVYNIGGVKNSNNTFKISCLEVFYLFDEDINCSVVMNWRIAEDPLDIIALNSIPELKKLFVYDTEFQYYFNLFFSKYIYANDYFYSVFENSHPSFVNVSKDNFVAFLAGWVDKYGENFDLLKKDLLILDMADF